MNGIIPVKDITQASLDPPFAKMASNHYRDLAAYMIGRLPAEQLLTRDERALYQRERQISPCAKPLGCGKLVVVLKATRCCNLRCTYCHSWAEGPEQTMSFAVLTRALRRILTLPDIHRFEFVWHGGEVTMLRPDFFKKLIWLQEQFRKPGDVITNSMQSNAVSLSPAWLQFLEAIGMSVGISLDGVPAINDTRRLDKRGRGTAARVAETIGRLRERGIPYGALIVVDRQLYHSDMRAMLEYFRQIALTNIEFLNIVPDNRLTPNGDPGEGYITYRQFIAFLSKMFLLWWQNYRTVIAIPMFEDFIRVLSHPTARLSACYWSGDCAREVITLEPNGTVTPCDKYVGMKNNNYGSLIDNDLATLLDSAAHYRRAAREARHARQAMKHCQWFTMCRGGCPHDRLINRRHAPDHEENCCGTGVLIETINQCLTKATMTTHSR
ncbi:Putative heme-binding protein [Sodalis praecaptivus]|uniref:Putative heme-binding protein n=1 Tax=Sodalis praecaptivus TaxID=1239307 RepID=W0HTW2_9GAMM|nr:darobactin maturation radical SAM/SPASM protein DarE [Sodalis praecaptivus]AHF75660.1 Putative heme-binding protein [Sodalis praecaptivus]